MHSTDPTFAKIRRERNTERFAFLSVIVALFVALVIQWRSPKPCVLSVGEKKLGYVATPGVAKRAEEQAIGKFRSRYGDKVRFQDDIVWYPDRPPEGAKVLELKDAVVVLEKSLKPLTQAVAIQVDGHPLVVVKSKSMAEDVLRQFMGQYLDPEASAQEPPKTREKVEFNEEWKGDAREVVTDVRVALEKLAASGSTEKHYAVEDGDTGYRVASKHKLTLKQLESLNPGTDLERLHIGQKLCVQKAKSPLTVVTVREETKVEDIMYPTRKVKSPSLPKGKTRVERPGKKGKREVTYRVVCENGVPVRNEQVGEGRLLSRYEERLIVEGTG